MSAVDRAMERFRSHGWSTGDFLRACAEDGVQVVHQIPAPVSHQHCCPACHEPYACGEQVCREEEGVFCKECYAVAEQDTVPDDFAPYECEACGRLTDQLFTVEDEDRAVGYRGELHVCADCRDRGRRRR